MRQQTRDRGPRPRIRAHPPNPRHPRSVLSLCLLALAAGLAGAPSNSDGIVRPKGSRYFQVDGRTFFPIGMNLCWPSAKGVEEYEGYFAKMQANGMNFCRVWLGPFDCFTIETKDGIDQAALKNLDRLLDLAEAHGIRVMLCIESFNSLRASPPYAMWDQCPYNKANGGPCANPQDFFTDPDARSRFKRRLATLIDRCAARTSVFAWELWNEVDIIERFDVAAVRDWHKKMAEYIKAHDPYHHLVTTSYARPDGVPIIDAVDGIDFVQIHFYDAQDFAERASDLICRRRSRVTKPVIIGEFGAGTQGEGNAADPTGVHLHNAIWASVMAGAAGCANIWWWDSYVGPKDLYHHYKSLAGFLRPIELSDEWVPFAARDFEYIGAVAPSPIVVDIEGDVRSWEQDPANRPATVTVDPDGTVHAPEHVPGLLHGLGGHKDKHNPITFKVDFAREGEFAVHVTGVSGWGGARLVVRIDGDEVLDEEFADPDGLDSKETLNQYNGDHKVKLPSGSHAVEVENTGPDWIYASYSFSGCALTDKPPLRCWGLARGGEAIAWVQQADSTWKSLARKGSRLPCAPSRVLLPLEWSGAARVELWDTWKGEPLGRAQVDTVDGRCWIRLPTIDRDIALRITPGSG
jgi:hypothetical protein